MSIHYCDHIHISFLSRPEYRRYEQGKIDNSTITQLVHYVCIKDHPLLYKVYAKRIAGDPTARVNELQTAFIKEQAAVGGIRMCLRLLLCLHNGSVPWRLLHRCGRSKSRP